MAENASDFNLNSTNDPIEILRLSIIDAYGLFPEVKDRFLELKSIGIDEGLRAKGLLEKLPGVKAAMVVTRDPDQREGCIFSINKKKYLEYYRLNQLSLGTKDGDKWDRLEELDRLTGLRWDQAQSDVYSNEVVQLISFDEAPVNRFEQVTAMSRQLLGDSTRAKAETNDWLHHMVNSEAKKPSARKRTALPSEWATKRNVTSMANRMTYEERLNLKKILAAVPEK